MLSTIAVGTDGSPSAAKAVDAAIDLASAVGARLLVLGAHHADPPAPQQGEHGEDAAPWATSAREEAQHVLDAACERAGARGVQASSVAAEGQAAEVLVRLATEHAPDVLVVGNKGVGVAYFLDSVAKSVVAHAPCDVYVAKTT